MVGLFPASNRTAEQGVLNQLHAGVARIPGNNRGFLYDRHSELHLHETVGGMSKMKEMHRDRQGPFNVGGSESRVRLSSRLFAKEAWPKPW